MVKKANKNQTASFTVIGSSGSAGSTLLADIIDTHPDCYCGPELYYFNHHELYKNFNYWSGIPLHDVIKEGILVNPIEDFKYSEISLNYRIHRLKLFMYEYEKHNIDSDYMAGYWKKATTFSEFTYKLISHILGQNHKKYYFEKTPSNAFCVNHLLTNFPNARYIHMIRDGRDVALSLVKRGLLPHAAVNKWLVNNALVVPYLNHPRVMIIKYEDLVTNPEKEIKDLFNFCNITYNNDLIKNLIHNRGKNGSRNHHDSWTYKTNEAIASKHIEKWRVEKDFIEILPFFKNLNVSILDHRYSPNEILSSFNYVPLNSDILNTASSNFRYYYNYYKDRIYRIVKGQRSVTRLILYKRNRRY